MKTATLTDYEIQFIKWRIWEPLRRNQDYLNEYEKLYKDGAEFKYDDPNPFCENGTFRTLFLLNQTLTKFMDP